jgi:phosphatidylglycerophosphate synthase
MFGRGRGVEIYGRRISDIPAVGRLMDSEWFLRTAANGLSVARIIGGPAVAGYVMATRPEDRSWGVGIGVALLAAGDNVDGAMIKGLKRTMTENELAAYLQSGKADFGAKLDHLADKAFVLPPMTAFASRGEISWAHPMLKIGRDVGTGAIKKAVHERTGAYPSASELGRRKAVAEMAAVAIGASPLSRLTGPDGETTLTEYAFRASTALSLASGAQYVESLVTALREVRIADVRELVIAGPGDPYELPEELAD